MVDLNKNGIDDSLESSGTNPYAAPSVGGGKSYPAQGTGPQNPPLLGRWPKPRPERPGPGFSW